MDSLHQVMAREIARLEGRPVLPAKAAPPPIPAGPAPPPVATKAAPPPTPARPTPPPVAAMPALPLIPAGPAPPPVAAVPATPPIPAKPAPSPVAAAPAPRHAAPAPVQQAAPASHPTAAPVAMLDALFEARPVNGGRGLFACRPIAKGTRLFGEDDWSDEEERRNFSTLSSSQLKELKPALRSVFLRYAYNTSPEAVSGAFRPEAVRHPVNFINHSCDPNAGYDGAGDIVALRGIAAGEEIRMDYGTYSFSFDHEFTCRCGASWCRGKVTGNDWPELVRAGLRLPAFMRAQANRALWG